MWVENVRSQHLEHAMLNDNTIFLTTQKDLRVETPEKEDLI